MFVPSGGSVTSFRGGMATGELLTLLRRRRTKAMDLGWLAPTDRDGLLWLMPTISPLEATVTIGLTTWTPQTTSIATADPTYSQVHSSPKISKSGLPSINLVQPTSLRSRNHNQAARPLGPSNTRRDPITPYLLLSVQGSMLATGSATVMYATFFYQYVG